MKEQDYQRKIIKFLESLDCYVVKVVSATKSGVPDLIFCYKGIFVGCEVKTPKTMSNTSELQKYNLRKIKEAGGYSFVAYSIDQVKEALNAIDRIYLRD